MKYGDMVKGLIGFTPRYIRFPGGSSNTVSRHYSAGIMSNLSRMVRKRVISIMTGMSAVEMHQVIMCLLQELTANATASRNNQIMILLP